MTRNDMIVHAQIAEMNAILVHVEGMKLANHNTELYGYGTTFDKSCFDDAAKKLRGISNYIMSFAEHNIS